MNRPLFAPTTTVFKLMQVKSHRDYRHRLQNWLYLSALSEGDNLPSYSDLFVVPSTCKNDRVQRRTTNDHNRYWTNPRSFSLFLLSNRSWACYFDECILRSPTSVCLYALDVQIFLTHFFQSDSMWIEGLLWFSVSLLLYKCDFSNLQWNNHLDLLCL